MNWVGGSRSRFMKNKEDTMKQRAFFQKQRMKAKRKNIDPQASPNGNNTGNMDLLTLFIVNQIASKKMHTGHPKTNLFDAKDTQKTLNEPLELPMSPCSPSKLNLVTSQPQYMATAETAVDTPGFKVRKQQIAKEFKFKPLSPLPESNLSDVSGSENQPHILNTYVPFSQRIKPANRWTAMEAHDLQNSPVAETQFGITLPNTSTEESAHSVLYPASPLKSSEQQEEPLFIDFSNRDHKENLHTEKIANIFLETSLSSSMRPKNSDGSQNMDRNGHFLTQEKVDQCLQYARSNEQISHTEDTFITKHCFLSANNSTSAPSQVPSCKQTIKKRTHDGNTAPKMQDAGTQTAAVSHISCCDVSVQCSLIPTNSINSPTTGVHTTRRQSVHFNEVSAGASATKQAQTHPKLPKGASSRKPHRQTSMKKPPILKPPILKRPLRKGLELKVGQLMERRVNIERCED